MTARRRFGRNDAGSAAPADGRAPVPGEARIRMGFTVEEISELTNVDPWFLHQLNDLIEAERWYQVSD